MSFILLPMLRSLAAESQCFHLVRILRESVVGPRPELEFGSGISRSCGTLRYTDRNLSSGLRRALGYVGDMSPSRMSPTCLQLFYVLASTYPTCGTYHEHQNSTQRTKLLASEPALPHAVAMYQLVSRIVSVAFGTNIRNNPSLFSFT